MSDDDTNPGALLPNGMLDGLPDTAERETEITHTLLQTFAGFGYREVNPPLVEFEESLLSETGGVALSKNTFRLMDPVSRRMMAIRSDTTTQIVRIAASRLKSSPRPLRLSYVADVLRVKGSQLRPERQFRQAGCELLGSNSPEASVEVALLAVYALHQLGVKNISIDFATPDIIRALMPEDGAEAFLKACQRRDEADFKAFGPTGKILSVLSQLAGDADGFFKQIEKKKLPPKISASFTRLKKVITGFRDGLKAYGLSDSVTITVDPLETRGFEYQTLPSFTLFARGVRGELGRGGFYEASFQLSAKKAHKEPANGFTLYMDSVLRAVPARKALKRIYVPAGTPWAQVRKIQQDGSIIRGTEAKVTPKDLAALGCTHIYKNSKIQSL